MGAKKQETDKTPKKRKDKNQHAKAQQEPLPACNYAPEWAEHARFNREDDPCDDGRMGGRPCAEDGSCPVTEDKPTKDIDTL